MHRFAAALIGSLLAGCHNTSAVTIPALSAAPPPMAQPMARAADVIRVVSYNVNFGLAGDAAGVEAVASTNADIIFLQETNEAWAASLMARLPRWQHRFTPPKTWPAGGMGLLSKYPIISVEELPSVAGPFFAWKVIVAAPGGNIQFLNVHLRPPMSDGGSWVVGYFSTREDRLREISWHAARLDSKIPTIILGDFNEEASGHAVRYAEDQGFTDAIAQFAGSRATWHWPVGDLVLRFQLDHLMYDKQLTVDAAGIIEKGNSDHLPVWADIRRIDSH